MRRFASFNEISLDGCVCRASKERQYSMLNRYPTKFVLRTLRMLVTIVAFGVALAGPSSSKLIDGLDGYYEVPSANCTVSEGDEQIPCSERSKDCLLISKIDDSHANFTIASTQINLNSCDVEGVAVLEGNKLSYQSQDRDDDFDFGKKFYMLVKGGYITFKYAPGAESGIRAPYCGQRARLDWIKFPLAVKQPSNNHSCHE